MLGCLVAVSIGEPHPVLGPFSTGKINLMFSRNQGRAQRRTECHIMFNLAGIYGNLLL
jgi:hypothetical protein